MGVKLSGIVRWILVLLVVMFAAGCVESSDEDANFSLLVESLDEHTNAEACYWDWQYTITPSIGQYYVAPTGYNYVLVQIYLKNNANQQVSTNPYYWKFTADGLQYDADVATYSEGINHQNIEVGKGGEIETFIVYLVKGYPAEAEIGYYNYQHPLFERIYYY